jgi:CheY-like chemotaxis protein/anti-sigma regulatory factor (Ser/Thr protein kinase)
VRLDPAIIVEAALELIRPAVEPTVRLVVDVPRGLPLVTVVPSEIEEVLMNLAVNARDASPPGSEVRLEARREGEGVAFAVEDAGSGVPDALHERIFEPFYTSKAAGTGTGLGLAVVMRVVRDHAGQVRVERSPAGGARFVAWFPAGAEHDALVAPDVRPHPRGCVFVVDDEPLVRDSAADVLRHAGCEVRAFASAGEALAAAREGVPGVLVTDVVMPDMDGLALAKAIVLEHPDARVILMSGFIPDTEPWGELRDGRWAVLAKPFRGEELVRLVLGGEPPRNTRDAIV